MSDKKRNIGEVKAAIRALAMGHLKDGDTSISSVFWHLLEAVEVIEEELEKHQRAMMTLMGTEGTRGRRELEAIRIMLGNDNGRSG